MEQNMEIFESKSIVNSYARQQSLQKPEQAILSILKDKLPSMRMLDVGVGAGRTTWNFLDLVKEYVGGDYSKSMIKVCQKNFGSYKHGFFKALDARSLGFKDNYFDFSLFSFNGIDCVAYEDRAKILKEIWRVSNPSGHFCFSTHNLNSVHKLTKLNLSKSLPDLFLEPSRLVRFWLNNKSIWKTLKHKRPDRQHLVFLDGAHNFRLKTCYVLPSHQIDQLTKLGFDNVRVFGLSDGKEIDCKEVDNNEDPWLYYLCNKK